MPRITRNHLLIALLALPLVSCFSDTSDCPTCPGETSASLEVLVPRNGLVDSVHASVDGGTQVTVRRDRRHTFQNLATGTHEVTITRWFFIDGLLSSRSSSLQIELAAGETRTVFFHNDFPLIACAPAHGLDRTAGARARHPIVARVG